MCVCYIKEDNKSIECPVKDAGPIPVLYHMPQLLSHLLSKSKQFLSSYYIVCFLLTSDMLLYHVLKSALVKSRSHNTKKLQFTHKSICRRDYNFKWNWIRRSHPLVILWFLHIYKGHAVCFNLTPQPSLYDMRKKSYVKGLPRSQRETKINMFKVPILRYFASNRVQKMQFLSHFYFFLNKTFYV